MSDTAIAPYGGYFRSLGKTVFAVFDEQDPADMATITTQVDHPFEHSYKGFEKLLTEEVSDVIIEQYVDDLIAEGQWPVALEKLKPILGDKDEYQKAAMAYLKRNKGSGAAADLLALCTAPTQFPVSIRKILKKIKKIVDEV
jgi:putative ATP-dependent endonuclease of OLD family